MQRTLAQALAGMAFPCDRDAIVEFARANELSAQALARLTQLPYRQYQDMAEVFTALPAKGGRTEPGPGSGTSIIRGRAGQSGAGQGAGLAPLGDMDFGWSEIMQLSLDYQRLWLQWMQQSLEMYQKLWFGWLGR